MKVCFLYIIIILLVVVSCKKEETKNQVFAGKNDINLSYKEFSPPFKIYLEPDSMNNIKYGIDSIDIDSDGNFDLIINQGVLIDWNDTVQISNTNYPYCNLKVKNGLELALKKETIYIGLGQTSELSWVDTLTYNTSINNIAQWSESNTNIWMWGVPPTTFWGSNGCWYNLTDTERYIGIRMKINSEYKLGWIRVYQHSREKIEIISYALEK